MLDLRGVVPTMITPFDPSGAIDWSALERMVDWYVDEGVNGLFAVCLSSECFHLSLRERVALAAFVAKQAGGRVPVVASGHVSWDMADQIDELRRMADTGVDAVVLIVNRLALPGQDEEAARRGLEAILEALPSGLPLGLYESPYPYHRLMSADLLRWCAQTGRFAFMKDTCCDADVIGARLKALKGSGMALFNANTATLLESLRMGAAGFSGIMGNFHPGLYRWLCDRWTECPDRAEALQALLGTMGLMGCQRYPMNAKYHFQLEGIPVKLISRMYPELALSPAQRAEVGQLHALWRSVRDEYGRS